MNEQLYWVIEATECKRKKTDQRYYKKDEICRYTYEAKSYLDMLNEFNAFHEQWRRKPHMIDSFVSLYTEKVKGEDHVIGSRVLWFEAAIETIVTQYDVKRDRMVTLNGVRINKEAQL